jgi:hypothetical protein
VRNFGFSIAQCGFDQTAIQNPESKIQIGEFLFTQLDPLDLESYFRKVNKQSNSQNGPAARRFGESLTRQQLSNRK